jgi:hypothetical protein
VPEQEAEIRWGGPSQFEYDNSDTNFTTTNNYNVTYPPGSGGGTGTDPDDEVNEKTYNFTETERDTTVVRVENPNDSNVYVDIERINWIIFEGPPEGEKNDIRTYWKFTLNWGQQQ